MAPIYRHGLRVTEPVAEGPPAPVEGVLDPQKRYDFDFTSEMVDPSTLTPEEIQDVFGEADIEDIPEQDYNLGRITTIRQFTDDMKIANEYKAIDPESYGILAQEAAATMQSRMMKLNMKRDKAEAAFLRIDQDVNSGYTEKQQFKTSYYDKNPIWKTPKVEYQRPKILSRGKPLAVSSVEDMAQRATDMAVTQESWKPFVGTSKKNIIKAVQRAADMAGWGDLNPATREALMATLDVKMKNTGETKETWDEDAENQIRNYIGLQTIAPVKPQWLIDYPDAVWNPQLKVWTVFKGGKLVALSEE